MTATEKPKRRWRMRKQDYIDRIAELERQVEVLTDERDCAIAEKGWRAFFPKRKKQLLRTTP